MNCGPAGVGDVLTGFQEGWDSGYLYIRLLTTPSHRQHWTAALPPNSILGVGRSTKTYEARFGIMAP